MKMPRWLASFLKGAGSVLQIWPTPCRRILTDSEAIASDWQKVGDDLQQAMDDVGEAIDKERPNV